MLTTIRNSVFLVFTFLLLTVTFSQECTSDGECDKHERCRVWREEGECYKNAVYMLEECPASCADEDYPTRIEKVCKDYHERCPVWADLGECEENPINMKRYCPLSCALCKDNTVDEEKSEEDCSDTNDKCGYWASLGECSANPNYMHNYCSASCGTCEILKKKNEKVNNLKEGILDGLTDEEKTLIALSADFGDKQHVSGSEIYETLDVIRKSIEYMKTDSHHLPEDIQEKW
jgi:ShK domain-like